jgi:hypothetical protein
MAAASIDRLPGFRRRIRITPLQGRVGAEVEDDYHCMRVIVHHDGTAATSIEADLQRAPWSTCPGAVQQLQQTFTGVPLAGFGTRGEKRANCTHLHDLAVLAAAHAKDAAPLVYDILVSDPVEGKRQAELRRNGESVLAWVEQRFQILEPPNLAGFTLDKLGPWIDSLDAVQQEQARLLRWGTMLANGRIIPMEKQSDASRLPPGSCYTLQPERAGQAKRIGVMRDFSKGTVGPLENCEAPL